MFALLSAMLASITVVLALFFLAVLFGTVLTWISARIVGIKKATFFRALGANFACSIVTWTLALLFSILPGIGTAFGALLGLVCSVFILQGIFDTSTEKAIGLMIIAFIGKTIAFVVAKFTFAAAFLTALGLGVLVGAS